MNITHTQHVTISQSVRTPPMTEQDRIARAMQDPTAVFVYGANAAGRHGAGAARTARALYGAVYGQHGFVGRSYGLVTKDAQLRSVSLTLLRTNVRFALTFMDAMPERRFLWTRVGCGLAGFTDAQLVECLDLQRIPENVVLPPEWLAMGQIVFGENYPIPRRRVTTTPFPADGI